MVVEGDKVGVSSDVAVGFREGPDGDEVWDRDGPNDGINEGTEDLAMEGLDEGVDEKDMVGTKDEDFTVGPML